MDLMTERGGRNIGLRIEIKDRLLAEALPQVIMARYKGVSVSAGADPAADFVLRDAPGGMVLLKDDEGRSGGVLAYFRYGDRAGRLVERLYELTGTEYRERGTLDRSTEAECIAFIASKGGIGTTTLARSFGIAQ